MEFAIAAEGAIEHQLENEHDVGRDNLNGAKTPGAGKWFVSQLNKVRRHILWNSRVLFVFLIIVIMYLLRLNSTIALECMAVLEVVKNASSTAAIDVSDNIVQVFQTTYGFKV